MAIEHQQSDSARLFRFEYEWSPNNTVAVRTESDYTVSPPRIVDVAFGYDARQRLLSDWRPVNDLRSTRAALQPGDLIGSTFLTTDAAGQAEQRAVYTAFGEYVATNGAIGGDLPAGFPRYAYAGEHGYEHGLLALFGVSETLPPITLLHVGERWYDPAPGRFLQRDPIGLAGAQNVYSYCEAQTVSSVDPDGLYKVIRDVVTERSKGRVLIHVYHEPETFWERLTWDGPRYQGTYSYCIATNGGSGNQLADDADDAAAAHGEALVNVAATGAGEGEKAAKDNVKRWKAAVKAAGRRP